MYLKLSFLSYILHFQPVIVKVPQVSVTVLKLLIKYCVATSESNHIATDIWWKPLTKNH